MSDESNQTGVGQSTYGPDFSGLGGGSPVASPAVSRRHPPRVAEQRRPQRCGPAEPADAAHPSRRPPTLPDGRWPRRRLRRPGRLPRWSRRRGCRTQDSGRRRRGSGWRCRWRRSSWRRPARSRSNPIRATPTTRPTDADGRKPIDDHLHRLPARPDRLVLRTIRRPTDVPGAGQPAGVLGDQPRSLVLRPAVRHGLAVRAGHHHGPGPGPLGHRLGVGLDVYAVGGLLGWTRFGPGPPRGAPRTSTPRTCPVCCRASRSTTARRTARSCSGSRSSRTTPPRPGRSPPRSSTPASAWRTSTSAPATARGSPSCSTSPAAPSWSTRSSSWSAPSPRTAPNGSCGSTGTAAPTPRSCPSPSTATSPTD